MQHEFTQIINGLKESINAKSKIFQIEECLNAQLQEKIRNINLKIKDIESSALDIYTNYPGNTDMLFNFRKRANEIKKEIESLKE